MKKTIVTISILRKDDEEWLFSIDMKLNDDDRDLPANCYRDLYRALISFDLYADLNSPPFKALVRLGPYIYHDNEDVFGIIVFKSDPESDGSMVGSRIRLGFNAAISIIRQGVNRLVRKRIKPVEQLLLDIDSKEEERSNAI